MAKIANIYENCFYFQCSFCFNSKLKLYPQDFIVNEIPKHGDRIIPECINFNLVQVPPIVKDNNNKTNNNNNNNDNQNFLVYNNSKDNNQNVILYSTAIFNTLDDCGNPNIYSEKSKVVPLSKEDIEIIIGENELERLKNLQQQGEEILKNYQKDTILVNTSITINIEDSFTIRREIYQYLRKYYSLIIAKPGNTKDSYIISLDFCLHPLLNYGVTHEELIALYHYIHKGPFDTDALNGICIAPHVSRSERTDIYRFITTSFKSLDSKTICAKREKCMKIFWKRRAQRVKRKFTSNNSGTIQTNTLDENITTSGKKRIRESKDNIEDNNNNNNNGGGEEVEQQQEQQEQQQQEVEVVEEEVKGDDNINHSFDQNVDDKVSNHQLKNSNGNNNSDSNNKKNNSNNNNSVEQKQDIEKEVNDENNHQVYSNVNEMDLGGYKYFQGTSRTTWWVWYTLVKINLEQVDCCRRISELLGISINHVTQAGVKDRRGFTAQKGCIFVDLEDKQLLKKLDISDNVRHEMLHSSNINLRAMRALQKIQEKLLSFNTPQIISFIKNRLFYKDRLTLQPNEIVDIGMAIGDLSFRDYSLSAGDLNGNTFNILLRNVLTGHEKFPNEGPSIELLGRRIKLLKTYGFPNFFGTQRMGVTYHHSDSLQNPLGPMIGKYLFTGNAMSAVYCILSGIDDGPHVTLPFSLYHYEDTEFENSINLLDSENISEESLSHNIDNTTTLQKNYLSNLLNSNFINNNNNNNNSTTTTTKSNYNSFYNDIALDPKVAFLKGSSLYQINKLTPPSMVREKKLVKALIRYAPKKEDVASEVAWECTCRLAIRSLPYTTKQLWISALQSWIWNNVAAYYLRMTPHEEEILTYPIPLNIGDVYLDSLGEPQLVTIHDSGNQIDRSRVVLPLIGQDWIQYPENHVGRYYLALLQKHNILDRDDLSEESCCGNCQDPDGCRLAYEGESNSTDSADNSCYCSISCKINTALRDVLEVNDNDRFIFGFAKSCYRSVLSFASYESICLENSTTPITSTTSKSNGINNTLINSTNNNSNSTTIPTSSTITTTTTTSSSSSTTTTTTNPIIPSDPLVSSNFNSNSGFKDNYQVQNLRVSFRLSPGCYATSYLRELLANDDLL